jgi:hypothetical protein
VRRSLQTGSAGSNCGRRKRFLGKHFELNERKPNEFRKIRESRNRALTEGKIAPSSPKDKSRLVFADLSGVRIWARKNNRRSFEKSEIRINGVISGSTWLIFLIRFESIWFELRKLLLKVWIPNFFWPGYFQQTGILHTSICGDQGMEKFNWKR